nr:carbon-nitrogen hydrolase family protein [Sphingomonas chungangi]
MLCRKHEECPVGQKIKAAAVQAAPAFLNLAAGVEKTCWLIEEAAANGSDIVAFPEAWIPGYPWWIWLDAPAWGFQFVERYHENSISVGSREMERIRRCVEHAGIHVVIGTSERDHGSLYLGQTLIAPDGQVLHDRRKLKPTHVERSVFGEGDGSHLAVHDTPIGRLGALCCWEHVQPLTKYALFSMHEQIHVASWPSFSLYEGKAHALGPLVSKSVSRVYAVEGQCFVIASCAVLSQEMQDMLCDTPAKRELLPVGGAYSMIYGPDGRELAEYLPENEEGIVYAELDLGEIALAKSAADPVGHYSRRDVTRLLLNRNPLRPTEDMSGPETSDARNEPVDIEAEPV